MLMIDPPSTGLLVPEAMAFWAHQHGLDATMLAWVALALLLGATKTQIAAFLGVSRQTVHKYCRHVSLASPNQWLLQVRDLLSFNPDPFGRGSVRT